MTSLRSAPSRIRRRRPARSPPTHWLAILRVGHGHDAPVDNAGAHAPWTTLRVAHVAHRRLDNPCGVAHMPTPRRRLSASAFPGPGSRAIGAFGAAPLVLASTCPFSPKSPCRFQPFSVAALIRSRWPDSSGLPCRIRRNGHWGSPEWTVFTHDTCCTEVRDHNKHLVWPNRPRALLMNPAGAYLRWLFRSLLPST